MTMSKAECAAPITEAAGATEEDFPWFPSTGRMHPRGGRCPPQVVFLFYWLHAALGFAFAWPLSKLVADRLAAHPRGDLILFEASGMYLTEILRLTRDSMASVASGGRFALMLVAFLGLLPLGALLHAIAFEGPLSLRLLLGAAGRFLSPLSLLLGLAIAAFALLTLVPGVFTTLLEDKLKHLGGDHIADIVKATIWLAALAAAAAVGIVHDLARAAVVSRDLPALPAAGAGVAIFRAFPGRAIAGWAFRAAAGALFVAGAAFITTKIGSYSGPRLLATAVLHQLVAFSLVWLRADWLAHAVGLCRALHAPEDD
jgi:hypothetical protein